MIFLSKRKKYSKKNNKSKNKKRIISIRKEFAHWKNMVKMDAELS